MTETHSKTICQTNCE